MKTLILLCTSILFFSTGCKKDDNNNGTTAQDIVYIQTNDFNSNQNAILAYRIGADAALTPLAGSPFATGGAGVGNPMQILGPDDSDTEDKITDDGKFLLTVNSGSNTISVFAIADNGSLTPVP